MQTEEIELESTTETDPTHAYFGTTDAIFVLVAIVVSILVIQLGCNTWQEGVKTEITKANGEQFAAWLGAHGAARAEGKAGTLPACDAEGADWKTCRDAIVGPGGPFPGLANVAEAHGKLFSPTCDKLQHNTHGSIIIAKGLPKALPATGFDYVPLEDGEALNEALPMRVSICGRGFSLIHIQEVTF